MESGHSGQCGRQPYPCAGNEQKRRKVDHVGYKLCGIWFYLLFVFLFRMSDYDIIYYGFDLHNGDHISWTSAGYRHHAIVSDAPTCGSKARIIHVRVDRQGKTSCTSSSKCSSGSGFFLSGVSKRQPTSNLNSFSVYEEQWDFGKAIQKRDLHRYRHAYCYEPHAVISRGRTRLGRFAFDPRTNNCEHFARWCKTGRHESYQAANAR